MFGMVETLVALVLGVIPVAPQAIEEAPAPEPVAVVQEAPNVVQSQYPVDDPALTPVRDIDGTLYYVIDPIYVNDVWTDECSDGVGICDLPYTLVDTYIDGSEYRIITWVGDEVRIDDPEPEPTTIYVP